jgi:hypothetical protein
VILINSDNKFYAKNIIGLLNQKNIFASLDDSCPKFYELKLKFYEKKASINFHDETIILDLPLSFESLLKKIRNILSKKFVEVSNFSYNPLMQNILFHNKECQLGVIHNIIFSNLVLNLNNGLEKNVLYSLLWPNDKNIQINKIDTHITNLKNKIKKDLSLDIKINSSAGIIKLIVD